MKETDAIIIMRNYLWMHKIEMSHTEREAFQRIIDALVLYRTEARGNCNQVATNLQLTCNVLISRADAMGAVQDHFNADGFRGYDDGQKMMDRIKALPSAETHEIRTETHACDCISRQDAIALVIKAIHGTDVEEIQEYLFNGLRKQMWSLPPVTPTERTGEWVPVSEGLPKEKQEVYVTVYFTEGDTGRAYGYIDGFGKWHLYSTVEGTLNSGYEVTAWMPLPEPYKAESEDKE